MQAGALTTTPLLDKFRRVARLDTAERALLANLPVSWRDVSRDQDLVREGEHSTACLFLVDGLACRYRTLPDGRRQIVSFHVPGDFLDLQGFLLKRLDHGIATLTASRLCAIPHTALLDLLESPTLTQLLWRETVIDGAIHREWIVNIGRRTAFQRIAHIFCELVTRLEAVGRAEGGVCDLPVTQGELADATGLSTVHVNRVIQELRRADLIAMRGRSFTALNWEGLKRAAAVDPEYLKLLAGRHQPPPELESLSCLIRRT